MAKERSLTTRCVRAGRPEGATGSLSPPIVQSSTFTFESMQVLEKYLEDPEQGFLYTRYENPTNRRAESALADLEGAASAVLFSSGMAAITTSLLTLLAPGDHVISMRSVYGGAYRFLRSHLPRIGVGVDFLETDEIGRFSDLVGPRTRLLYLETPTNPTLGVVDLADLAARAHPRGLTVMVDSTFATPIAQQPLAVGCDLVMHSASKYLAGHSDVIGGVVMGSNQLIGPIRENLKVHGGSPDPFAAWLLLRGLRTLPIRMEAHQRGALTLARALEGRPGVKRVLYPGLASHPHHDLARRQMKNFGGVVCLELESFEAARRVMNRFRLIERAASLGGVESIASIPVMTSHTGYSDEELARAGVARGMIRLSVGLEDPVDLVEDLDQALGT